MANPSKWLTSWQQWWQPLVDPSSYVHRRLSDAGYFERDFSVLPDLKGLRLSLLDMPSRQAAPQQASRRFGLGEQFRQLRQYQPGDDLRQIHWPAYARTGEPQVRQYNDDRQCVVWLVLDQTPTMAFGHRHPKWHHVIELTLALTALYQGAGHQVGLLIIDGSDPVVLAPRGGKHQQVAIDQLLVERLRDATLFSEQTTVPHPQAVQEGLSILLHQTQPNTRIVWLSDFSYWGHQPDQTTQAENDFIHLCRNQPVVVYILNDPHEQTLPTGPMPPLADRSGGWFSGGTVSAKDQVSYQQSWQRYQQRRQQALQWTDGLVNWFTTDSIVAVLAQAHRFGLVTV